MRWPQDIIMELQAVFQLARHPRAGDEGKMDACPREWVEAQLKDAGGGATKAVVYKEDKLAITSEHSESVIISTVPNLDLELGATSDKLKSQTKFTIRCKRGDRIHIKASDDVIFDPGLDFDVFIGNGSTLGFLLLSKEEAGADKDTWFVFGAAVSSDFHPTPMAGDVKFSAVVVDAHGLYSDPAGNLWYKGNGESIGPEGSGADIEDNRLELLYKVLHESPINVMADGKEKANGNGRKGAAAQEDWTAARALRPLKLSDKLLGPGVTAGTYSRKELAVGTGDDAVKIVAVSVLFAVGLKGYAETNKEVA